jgi:hypothetical protein
MAWFSNKNKKTTQNQPSFYTYPSAEKNAYSEKTPFFPTWHLFSLINLILLLKKSFSASKRKKRRNRKLKKQVSLVKILRKKLRLNTHKIIKTQFYFGTKKSTPAKKHTQLVFYSMPWREKRKQNVRGVRAWL